MKGKYITTQIIMACLASEAERKSIAANKRTGIDIDKNAARNLIDLAKHGNELQSESHLKVA